MQREMMGSSLVIVANQFNPSVITPIWLNKHGLVAEGEFQKGCIFADGLVQVRTENFLLLASPEQLQFAPNHLHVIDPQRLLLEKAGRLVELLPYTPYRAVGLNFTWHLIPKEGEVPKLTRELFFKPHSELYKKFEEPDARFGAYLSKDFLGFRLKLDVKPMTVTFEEGRVEERVQFLFNYHAEIPESEEEPAKKIQAFLGRWNEVGLEAKEIMGLLDGGGQK